MSSVPVVISANHLLAALPRNDYKRLLASCVETELAFAEVLYRAGDLISHIYFPTTGIISLVTPVDGNHNLEVGLIGQGAGQALRLSTPEFLRELEKSAPLKQELKRYLYVVMSQIAQTAGCNRFHVVEARLARWLLMTQDRAQSDQFHVTHVFLAYMLGVRRVGITKAANSLQNKGLISYKRGEIKILNRAGLEEASCECYRTEKAIYERILG